MIEDALTATMRPRHVANSGRAGRPAHLVAAGAVDGQNSDTDAWRSHCSAGLDVYGIGGNHTDVLSGTHANDVAEVFWKLWWEQ